MVILGLFGPGYNPSSALIVNGKLTAFAEEERFCRIKTAPDALPVLSARACLKKAGLDLDAVDAIAYGWDCARYVTDAPEFFAGLQRKFQDTTQYNRLEESLNLNLYHPERITNGLQRGLASLSKKRRLPPITFFPHHLCHAASAFYCSGFSEANILTLDGSGEETTTLLACGKNGKIETLDRVYLPHSLGGFYATFTEFMGFKPYMDEGKLMGLASYGRYDQALQDKLERFIRFDSQTGYFEIDPSLRYNGKHTYGGRFTDTFVELFGQPRDKESSALDAPYPDLAFAVQWRLEQIVTKLAHWLYQKTGFKKLCLAGGVAMNCVMNGKLAAQDFVEDIFVQPAASDNGAALGAALLLGAQNGESVSFKMTHLYYGPEYAEAEIEKAFTEAKVEYRKSPSVAKEIARYLNAGYTVGWCQGSMEVGARSLGNRSILANPLIRDMKDKLNLEVKHRENWRPFCPSMKAESYGKYIDAQVESPFMIMAFPVKEEFRNQIPAVVHVDGTARPQAVSREDNLRFWTLLDEFEKLSGHGVLVNTSFNIQGEPVVCTPRDALRCFGGTGIDVLAFGDFISLKPHVKI